MEAVDFDMTTEVTIKVGNEERKFLLAQFYNQHYIMDRLLKGLSNLQGIKRVK